MAQQTIEAKKEYLIKYNDVMGHISVIESMLDIDSSGQGEVFRKHIYGGLSEAVKKYRGGMLPFEKTYKDRTEKIEEIVNKELVKDNELLSGDAECTELNKLLNEAIKDMNDYLEDTTNPTGTYYTYAESSSEKSKKLKQSYSDMETKFKYILESNGMTLKDVKEQDNNGKTQTNK